MNHPTLRTIVGATPANTIAAASSALLVIDFQNEYFSGKMPLPDAARALRNARLLIDHADRANIPVFHVQHVAPAGSPIFAEHSASGQFHAELRPAPHHTVLQKSSVSVFASTDLDHRLKAAGITTLLIAGLMTHACVSGAARDAVPLGYAVIVAHDACATRDLDRADGGVLPHADLHRAALAAIDDTFGDIMSSDQILQLALT